MEHAFKVGDRVVLTGEIWGDDVHPRKGDVVWITKVYDEYAMFESEDYPTPVPWAVWPTGGWSGTVMPAPSGGRKYIASLLDHGALSGTIEFFVGSVNDAMEIIASRGRWIRLPETDGDVLLSDGVSITLIENPAPFRYSDIPSEKWQHAVENGRPVTHTLSVGTRGGVNVER